MYFLPVTFEVVKEIIAKDKPDGILLQFGGQTALNCGSSSRSRACSAVQLPRPRDLRRDIATEDRDIFSQKLLEINEIAQGYPATTVQEAVDNANRIGYPVILAPPSRSAARSASPTTTRCCAPRRRRCRARRRCSPRSR